MSSGPNEGTPPTAGGGARRGMRRRRDATEELAALEVQLAAAFREPPTQFVPRTVRAVMGRRISEPDAFNEVAGDLRRRGVRVDGDQLRALAVSRGWWVAGQPANTPDRRVLPPERSRGFWSTISTERHIREVSGGLPSLGKRR